MSTNILSSGLVTKDPDSAEVFVVDWGQQRLATAVTIDTSTWTVTGADATLVDDEASILSGSRKTQIRLTGGTLHKLYTVTNTIVTNESPAQTLDASFDVWIEQE